MFYTSATVVALISSYLMFDYLICFVRVSVHPPAKRRPPDPFRLPVVLSRRGFPVLVDG